MPNGPDRAYAGIPAQQSITEAFKLLRRAELLRAELTATVWDFSRLLTADSTLGGMMAAWFDCGGVTSDDFVAWLAAGCPPAAQPVPRRGDFRLVIRNGEGI